MRETALATSPAVLLGQAGQTPFSNYVIKPDETGVTGAIVSSCSSWLACRLKDFCARACIS